MNEHCIKQGIKTTTTHPHPLLLLSVFLDFTLQIKLLLLLWAQRKLRNWEIFVFCSSDVGSLQRANVCQRQSGASWMSINVVNIKFSHTHTHTDRERIAKICVRLSYVRFLANGITWAQGLELAVWMLVTMYGIVLQLSWAWV